MGRKKQTLDTRIIYPYDVFYSTMLARHGVTVISDKEMADILSREDHRVSERQVRNAKYEGMDAYKCDLFCIRGLGELPYRFYPSFIGPEGYFAEELNLGTISQHDVDLVILDQAEWINILEAIEEWELRDTPQAEQVVEAEEYEFESLDDLVHPMDR